MQNGVLNDVAPVIEDGVMDTSVIITLKIEIKFTVWYPTCIHVWYQNIHYMYVDDDYL